MHTCLQSLLGDLLHAVRTGLDHEADVLLDGGPPEVHSYVGNGGLHAIVAS